MAHLVGKPAPGFTAVSVIREEFKDVSLKDYKSKYLLLFFYPMDFTGVCLTEIVAISEQMEQFKQRGCEVLAVSCDSHFTHLAWIKQLTREKDLLNVIPLLADKSGRIAKDYSVYNQEQGFSKRAYFLIDNQQVIRDMSINDHQVGRTVKELLVLLDVLQFEEKKKDENVRLNEGVKRHLPDNDDEKPPIKSFKKSDESPVKSALQLIN